MAPVAAVLPLQLALAPALRLAAVLLALQLAAGAASVPSARPLVGINYFAGWWRGVGDKWFDPRNASFDWRPAYPQRAPLLGQYNTQATMDAEIVAAAGAGVDFFQFLYYDNYNSSTASNGREPNTEFANRGLTNFLTSPHAGKMHFFIEWCNAQPHFGVQNDSDWQHLVHNVFLPAMKHPSYLRVGGALVFKIINAGMFLKFDCGMNHTLAQERWAGFRAAARAQGLGEMIIGAGMAPDDMTAVAWWGGEQYNWTGLYAAVDDDAASFAGQVLPWKNESDFVDANRRRHAATNLAAGVPFVPMVMSGWDPRPWHEQRASFEFPTVGEWEAELRRVQAQLSTGGVANLGFPLPGGQLQPAFNVYSWNEFGEGGIMAPSHGWDYTRLEAITKVFGMPSAQPADEPRHRDAPNKFSAKACTTDMDCSLNGACAAAGDCVCDSGWTSGAKGACELLDLLPADLGAGYNRVLGHAHDNGSVSSWGATQLRAADGTYHTFVGEMEQGCGINGFETNEQIVHATSDTAVGPWARQGTLHPFGASAVCPHAQRDPSTGEWLIFHTGCGNHANPASEPAPLLRDCVNGTTGPSSAPSDLRPKAAPKTCGVASDVTAVFVAPSPLGPWRQQLVRVKPAATSHYINGVPWPGCDGHDNGYNHWTCNATLTPGGNPTALVLKNGTTLLLFRTYYQNASMCRKLGMVLRSRKDGNGYPGCTVVGLARAPHWSADYELIGGPIVPYQQEDPYIYHTKRGFHAVFHGMDPWPSQHTGRHAFSEDGITWHGGDVDCWNNTVALLDGSTIVLARRERPELLHDAEGRPVALLSGAQFGAVPGNAGDQTFTLSQPVRVRP